MQGRTADGRTLAREAYFLGGIARRTIAEQVLQSGVAIIGIATALAAMPEVAWKDKALVSLARMALVRRRLHGLAEGAGALASYSPVFTLLLDQLRGARLTRRYRAWLRTAAA